MMPEKQIRLDKSGRFVNFLIETKMKEKPAFDRYLTFLKKGVAVGRRPDGQWIFTVEDLPILPIPRHAVVTRYFIEFDEWIHDVFP
jgi:hypothetical protein